MYLEVILERMLSDFLDFHNNYSASSKEQMQKDFLDSVLLEVESFVEDQDWEQKFEYLEYKMKQRHDNRVRDGEPL
jgi:hypothetical protein